MPQTRAGLMTRYRDARGWNSMLGTFLNVTKTLVSRTAPYASCAIPFPLCYGICCYQYPFPYNN